jgi:hypothetical protein
VSQFFFHGTNRGDRFRGDYQKLYDEGIQIALKRSYVRGSAKRKPAGQCGPKAGDAFGMAALPHATLCSESR